GGRSPSAPGGRHRAGRRDDLGGPSNRLLRIGPPGPKLSTDPFDHGAGRRTGPARQADPWATPRCTWRGGRAQGPGVAASGRYGSGGGSSPRSSANNSVIRAITTAVASVSSGAVSGRSR